VKGASFVCSACGRTWDIDTGAFRCSCGGLLDLGPFEPTFPPKRLRGERSIFRYAEAMPFGPDVDSWREVTMGEGLTPLVPLDPGNPGVLVKLDYAMPTLSFKDRGAAVVVAKAHEIGVRKIVQDSSGNAGASIAAYAARAGIPCEVFVPEGTSANKANQIAAYGATVRTVPGSREDTAAAALEAADRPGTYYASHVYNPLFYQGTKTYLYEIYESLGNSLPGTLFVPLGNGTLFLGVYYGLLDLKRLGLVETPPLVIAVQAEGCSPVFEAFRKGSAGVEAVVNGGTEAEGIAIASPLRGNAVLSAIREIGAEVMTAPESGLAPAKRALALKGFHVETTTAATFAAYFLRAGLGPDGTGGGEGGASASVVIPLCGAGLKGH
jgi:threonine synthase